MEASVPNTNLAPRLGWVDWAKACAIVGVMVGHADCPIWLDKVLYTFHVPVFFLVSGYLTRATDLTRGFASFFACRLRSILVWYICFSTALLPLRLVAGVSGNASAPLDRVAIESVLSVLYASGDPRLTFSLFPAALWFFPALFIAKAALFLFVGVNSAFVRVGLLLAAAAIAWTIRSWYFPWEVETGLMAFIIVTIGYAMRGRAIPILGQASIWIAGFIPLLVGSFMAIKAPQVDFYIGKLEAPAIQFPSMVLMTTGVCRISMSLPCPRLVRWLSKSSLVLFPTHQVVFLALDRIALIIEMQTFRILVSSVVCKIACAMAFAVLAQEGVRRLNLLYRLSQDNVRACVR